MKHIKNVKMVFEKLLNALRVLHGEKIVAALCAGALCATTATAQTPPITATTPVAIERWVDAVTHHVPGKVDEALLSIEQLTVDDRAQLQSGMTLFRDALAGKLTRVSSAAQKRIVDIGLDAGRDPGLTVFVARAIMLHGDAAILAVQRPELVPASGRSIAVPPRLGTPVPNQQVLERDGELVGATESNWNWAFARELVRLEEPPAASPFLATWFHATSAFLMSQRQYGEAQMHLMTAGAVLPRDAHIRFDRACYAEMQGLPESQVLLSKEDIAAMRAQSGTNMRNNLMVKSDAAKRTGVRPANVENAEAERLFRSALDVDPDFAEARVRLARLLEIRGRHAEAKAEAGRALVNLKSTSGADSVVAFFAHLVGGRVDRALGLLDTAAAHFQDALVLFPNAQSALLGASQVAVLRADVAGALAAVRRLDESAPDSSRRVDPWWIYSMGLGRNADVLLSEMWATARQK